MPTLLQRLGLEHYQQRFEEEEVDFDTFLTMSESDLKEMGINTVGARRKLQIAISGTAIILLLAVTVITIQCTLYLYCRYGKFSSQWKLCKLITEYSLITILKI